MVRYKHVAAAMECRICCAGQSHVVLHAAALFCAVPCCDGLCCVCCAAVSCCAGLGSRVTCCGRCMQSLTDSGKGALLTVIVLMV